MITSIKCIKADTVNKLKKKKKRRRRKKRRNFIEWAKWMKYMDGENENGSSPNARKIRTWDKHPNTVNAFKFDALKTRMEHDRVHWKKKNETNTQHHHHIVCYSISLCYFRCKIIVNLSYFFFFWLVWRCSMVKSLWILSSFNCVCKHIQFLLLALLYC